MNLNGTHQFWFYADDVNMLGLTVHTVKGKAGTFVVVGKEIGLEVNVDRTKYMVMHRDRNAGRNHMKINNSSFERVEEFKYWEKF